MLFATAVVDNGSAAVEPWLTQEVCGAFQRRRKLIFVFCDSKLAVVCIAADETPDCC